MTDRRLFRAVAIGCAVLVPLLFAACSTVRKPLPQEPGLHPRLAPHTYLEEGNIAVVTVDVEAAMRRPKEAYIPIAFSFANKSLPKVTLTRESFTLVDEEGNRYPMASVAESRSMGNFSTSDHQFSETYFEIMASTFQTYTYESSTFFPVLTATRGPLRHGVVHDRIELNTRMWTSDILYFPHPKGELLGHKFELWVSAPELPEPVFVKFRVK